MSAEDASADESGEEPEPTNLSRDERPEVRGHGPTIERDANGDIREIEIEVGYGKRSTTTRHEPRRDITLTYAVLDCTARVRSIQDTTGGHAAAITPEDLRVLALADDVVGRVPGVVGVDRFELDVDARRNTYERELDERCAEGGCYDMPDKALDSGRCREHTPEAQR